MSKRNKKHDYQLRYIRKNGKVPHENFARIYRSLFYDEKFKSLSPNAKNLYVAICLECKNNKRIACIFPKSAYETIMNKRTFHKCKKELIENGFIEEIAFKTKPNLYYLSDEWKNKNPVKKNPKTYTIEDYDKLLEGVKKDTSE